MWIRGLDARLRRQITSIKGRRYRMNGGRIDAESEAIEVNRELRWCWLLSKLRLVPVNFERDEDDGNCEKKCR